MPRWWWNLPALAPAAALALAAAVVLAGCAPKPADPPGPGGTPAASAAKPGGPAVPGQGGGRRFALIPVQAVTVRNGTLVTDNQTAGTVTPRMQSAVAAQVAGVVARVPRSQGDWVKAGALVVQLDTSALKLAERNAELALENAKINLAVGQQTSTESEPRLSSQLDSAKTSLSAAQKNYESQKKLLDLGGISASQMDNSQSQLQQAQANVMAAQLALDQNRQSGSQTLAQLQLAVDQATVQLQIARLNLANASIAAPFEGQIVAINVTPGMYVSLNTPAFVLVSSDKQINFTVPPTDAPGFRVGSTVQFTYAGRGWPVRIIQDPSAPINGVVPMAAELPRLVPAPYGSVGTIGYKLDLASGLLIPIASLVTRADQNLVYSIVDGKAVEQQISVVAEAGTTAVVKGLQPGMQIIVSPPPGLLPGSAVQPVVLPQDSAGTSPPQGPAPGSRPGGQPGGKAGIAPQGGRP